jgi:hypothetical protein
LGDLVSFAAALFPRAEPADPLGDGLAYRGHRRQATLRDCGIRRLMVNLPPRHLKSLLASVAFPARCLGHEPAQILCVSYAQDLADKLSRDCRQIIASKGTKGSSRLACRRNAPRCPSSTRRRRAAGSRPRSAAC